MFVTNYRRNECVYSLTAHKVFVKPTFVIFFVWHPLYHPSYRCCKFCRHEPNYGSILRRILSKAPARVLCTGGDNCFHSCEGMMPLVSSDGWTKSTQMWKLDKRQIIYLMNCWFTYISIGEGNEGQSAHVSQK